MLPFIGAGISLISGAVSNLFTGEGRERRQARRLERRQKRATRQAGRITVKKPAARVPYYPPTKVQPTQADIKAPRKPAGQWIQENWYFIAGGAAVLLLIVFMTTKKKKVVRRRKKSNPGSTGSSSSSKSNPGSKSRKKNSPAHVMKQWQKAKAGGSKMGLKAAWAKFG